MANRDAGNKGGNPAAGGAAEGHGDEPRARAAGAKKPGVLARGVEQARGAVESIQLPRPDWRTFLWGLLVLVLIALIASNWAPLRISFFGLYFDAPRAVVLLITFLLGMMTAWLLEVRSKRKATVETEEEEAAVTEEAGAEEPGGLAGEDDEAEIAEEEEFIDADDREIAEMSFDQPQESAHAEASSEDEASGEDDWQRAEESGGSDHDEQRDTY